MKLFLFLFVIIFNAIVCGYAGNFLLGPFGAIIGAIFGAFMGVYIIGKAG